MNDLTRPCPGTETEAPPGAAGRVHPRQAERTGHLLGRGQRPGMQMRRGCVWLLIKLKMRDMHKELAGTLMYRCACSRHSHPRHL